MQPVLDLMSSLECQLVSDAACIVARGCSLDEATTSQLYRFGTWLVEGRDYPVIVS